MRAATTLFVMMVGIGSARALPPGGDARGFVEGANHRVGDAGFVAAHGREPTAADSESERMHTHLVHMRRTLGAGPATRPELATRRATLLGYLDDYIASRVTPQNHAVPWRNPVFVDGVGRVCAVGYLIARSEGRALVERIADAHRTDYLEDIAAAMPEVAAWVASSGFTLDELASIQPGYSEPIIEQWEQWELGRTRPDDGPWLLTVSGVTTRGAWRDGQMHGLWTREDGLGRVIGRGEFRRGRGTWTSTDASGRVIAEGAFRDSYPDGPWRLFHPSGALAARGNMARGHRFGRWTFYHDGPRSTPIARGKFARGGRVTGTWTHHDANGDVFATTARGPDTKWGEEVLMMEVKSHGPLKHALVEGTFMADYQRVDRFVFEGERYYREADYGTSTLYSADGKALSREGDRWLATSSCWSKHLAGAARRGDLLAVRAALFARRGAGDGTERCEAQLAEVVAPEAGARLDRLVAAIEAEHVPAPEFVRAYFRETTAAFDATLGDMDDTVGAADGDGVAVEADVTEEAAPAAEEVEALPTNLVGILAANMTWYVEWPHVDGAFARVFETLPGHYPPGQLYPFALPSDGTYDPDDAGITRVASTSGNDEARPVVSFR